MNGFVFHESDYSILKRNAYNMPKEVAGLWIGIKCQEWRFTDGVFHDNAGIGGEVSANNLPEGGLR
jgi:hypothetical protein